MQNEVQCYFGCIQERNFISFNIVHSSFNIFPLVFEAKKLSGFAFGYGENPEKIDGE
jgi:hypothetical protein